LNVAKVDFLIDFDQRKPIENPVKTGKNQWQKRKNNQHKTNKNTPATSRNHNTKPTPTLPQPTPPNAPTHRTQLVQANTPPLQPT
jgi:hypothetical protein